MLIKQKHILINYILSTYFKPLSQRYTFPVDEWIVFYVNWLNLRRKKEWICSERPITICIIVKTWLCPGSRIWSKCVVSRRQRPWGLPYYLHNKRNLCTNMPRTQLLGYSPQPACSGWLAGFISTCFYSSKIKFPSTGCLWNLINFEHVFISTYTCISFSSGWAHLGAQLRSTSPSGSISMSHHINTAWHTPEFSTCISCTEWPLNSIGLAPV